MSHISLRTKGLIYISIIALIPLLVAGLFNYQKSIADVIEMEIEKVKLKHENRDYVISSSVNEVLTELKIMSRTARVKSGERDKIVSYLLGEQEKSDNPFEEIGFIGKSGKAIVITGKSSVADHQAYFMSASVNETVVINGDIYDAHGNLLSYISVPVFDDEDQFIGSLYGKFLFPAQAFLEKYDLSDEQVYIYDINGTMIFNKNFTSVKEHMENKYDALMSDYILHHLEGNTGYMIKTQGMSKYLIIHMLVNNNEWVMLEIIPMSDIRSAMLPALARILFSILIIAAIAGFLFYNYFNTIIKRLNDILRVTKLAADGVFTNQHLDAGKQDEIGILAHSVNGMMNRLQLMFDRLDAVINQNQNPVIVLDENYKFSYLNKAAEEMLGIKGENLIGKATMLMFMDYEEVEERARAFSEEVGYTVKPGVELFIEMRKRYPSLEFEFTLISSNGRRIPVHDRSAILKDRKGKFAGIIAILQDLSEQKKIETARNRLQEIVESARDLIASVDRQSNIIYINEAGKKMLAIEDEEWKTRKIKDYLPPELYKRLLDASIVARSEGYFETDLQFKNLKNKTINVSIGIVTHVESFSGNLIYSCIARDITEQLETQQKLVEATENAESANRAKSNFLALMSHEIRTPLNGIIGLAQLLQKTHLDFVQREYVQKMKDSSDTLLHIVNDILDFSKLEVSKVEIEYRQFHISQLIDHISDQLSVLMGGKDLFEFKIIISEHIPNLLIGDALRLEQILNNLCVNAIKFTEHGIVELAITMIEQSENKVSLKFSVKDTGIGMTEEHLKKLFIPFTQADSSTTRKYGGTGLGLVISQILVRLLGGELHVQSKLNEGSKFSFTLQFDVPEQEQVNKPLLKKTDSIVWIVEDNDDMASYWAKLLTEEHLTSVRIASWKQAYYRLLRIGKGAYPAFIVLDMEMHDMYGMDTWLEFMGVALERKIPLLVMTTTYGREELLLLDAREQPALILTKPITPLRFQQAIQQLSSGNLLIKSSSINEELDLELPTNQHNSRELEVLLAEDNKVNQLVATEMLYQCNCNVTVANHGLECIQLIEKDNFDLILMDIHMPNMDGIEATKWIRARNQFDHIPIIAVTANILTSDHEHYLSIGMQKVITKPIDLKQIKSLIADVLSQETKAEKPFLALASHSIKKIDEHSYTNIHNKLIKLQHVNVNEAVARVNGKVNIYYRMLEQFYKDYATFIPSVTEKIEVENLSAVQRMLHTLKGASAYLGAEHLHQISSTLEAYAKQKNVEKLHELLPSLRDELDKILQEIANL